jgi:putative PIN family toxin of toxin-antitoxin system
MLRAVLDTNILVSARRSRTGASNALLHAADLGSFRMLVSVPLLLEYEAVLSRPEHLLATHLTEQKVAAFLDYLAGIIEPVKLHYLWRPQLGDAGDEMVLETAINGRADCIVTFNTRHFGSAARFGVETIWPNEAFRRFR